jgi:indole-3-glycerol phosphate synthase
MILDDIIRHKQQEVSSLQKQYSGKNLNDLVKALPKPRDFLSAIKKGKFSLIAEIKKASPSAGLIRPDFEPITLAKTYEESGAAALSVLTDEKYFQGKLEYLKAAKESTTIPVLRKDFIIAKEQVYEARIAGADALLLIVRILSDEQLKKLLELTERLAMQALVETHNAEEVERALKTNAKIIGINNRDLDTLKIDLQTSIQLIEKLPQLNERIVISESGIVTNTDIQTLKKAGADGVLIGETLMKSKNIPEKIRELMGG